MKLHRINAKQDCYKSATTVSKYGPAINNNQQMLAKLFSQPIDNQ